MFLNLIHYYIKEIFFFIIFKILAILSFSFFFFVFLFNYLIYLIDLLCNYSCILILYFLILIFFTLIFKKINFFLVIQPTTISTKYLFNLLLLVFYYLIFCQLLVLFRISFFKNFYFLNYKNK